jgi:hypothetical protein
MKNKDNKRRLENGERDTRNIKWDKGGICELPSNSSSSWWGRRRGPMADEAEWAEC